MNEAEKLFFKKDAKNSKKAKLTPQLKEMIFLAERASAGGIKVLPGKSWAYHYKKSPQERQTILEGLLSGKYDASQIEDFLKPDALIYDAQELETKGLEAVSARIMNETSQLAYYDYKKYADFMNGLKGLSITPEKANALYDELTKSRIQKSLRDALNSSGKKSLDNSLIQESERIVENFKETERTTKVLEALKLDWMCEEKIIDSSIRDRATSELSGEERKTFNEMKEEYQNFVKSGDSKAYENMVCKFKDGLTKLEKPVSEGGSESMKDLEKELEKTEEVAPVGTEKDPAIPPEDNDEYHTPTPNENNPTGKKENGPGEYYFAIEPPLSGYYVGGKKSYFDINRKTWSKKKQLTPYLGSTTKGQEYLMKGTTNGITVIPLPTGYAINLEKMTFSGEKPKIFRDQNGCFYFETKSPSTFSITFSQEEEVFTSQPIKEDTQMLYQGTLSQKTESFIASVRGGPLEKAEKIRQHILANHFYPGGGDSGLAQKLQAKLRNENNGDDYIKALDVSEYLECYSANTKFVAMLRKSGIPARLVLGHHVQGSQKGVSYIDSNNGHAWAEVWDGRSWRRFDATPPAKPEDKKKDEDEKEKQENAPEANDGGVDSPQQNQEKNENKGEKSDKKGEKSNESQQTGEASDSDLSNAENKVKEAQEKIQEAEKEKKELMEQIEKTDKFKDLEELKKELEEKELLEEMKDALENAIDAKEEMMKDELKERLEKMSEDGFLEEEELKKMLEQIEEEMGQKLDELQKQIEEDNKLYLEYEKIKAEIEPLVDEWFQYFIDKLPRQQEVSIDEDSLSRQGAFDRRSVNRPRNIIFGTVKNPRVIDSSVKPLFLASIMVDVSGSMAGSKLENARKLLIFYSELFAKIKEQFGYINFSINTFSDSMQEIKNYDQDYDSAQAYKYADGTRSTIKVRLMKHIKTQGGTNMLDPIKRAAQDLSKQTYNNPDYASSFYFVGDGGDTQGNAQNIKKFLQDESKEHGFGDHMLSAILLGSEQERHALGEIFGEEHTNVASNFDELIKNSMERFDDDIEIYFRGKTI